MKLSWDSLHWSSVASDLSTLKFQHISVSFPLMLQSLILSTVLAVAKLLQLRCQIYPTLLLSRWSLRWSDSTAWPSEQPQSTRQTVPKWAAPFSLTFNVILLLQHFQMKFLVQFCSSWQERTTSDWAKLLPLQINTVDQKTISHSD